MMPLAQLQSGKLPRARLIDALSSASPFAGRAADMLLPGSLSDPTLGMLPMGFVNFGKMAPSITERASDPIFTMAESATHNSIIGDAASKFAGLAARMKLRDFARQKYEEALLEQRRQLEQFTRHLSDYKARGGR